MKTNCPLGNKATHDCYWCIFNGHRESNVVYNPQGKKCTHPDYKMKVKPHKIEKTFCTECGKDVAFKIDWEGVASPTREGIVTYKELYAICNGCGNEVYVPAINDINVYRREKAYRKLIKAKSEGTK